MTEKKHQKAKLLLLMEILWQESDRSHPLTTRNLLAHLAQKGISCDRRTLSRDMDDLNELGFEVMSVMLGHEKGYYTDDRQFSIPELRILMDAVQAAEFIPKDKSSSLMRKISNLGGSYRAKLLQNNTIFCNTAKHENESIYYTIDAMEEAISMRQKVSFVYFDLNENKEKIYRKNGERYLVEPVGMILSHDRYYLTAVSPDREGVSVYRLVRMEKVAVEPEKVSTDITSMRRQIIRHTSEVFEMYLGTPETVTLEFDKKLLGAVFDHFGENITVQKLDESHCVTKVTVQVSPTFFGWLFQFGDMMKLMEPETIVRQIRDVISRLPY